MPDTIASRTLLAVVLALLVSQGLGIFFYISDHRNAVNLIGGEHVSERIVTLTHLIDNAPVREQSRMVAFADETALHVTATESPAVPAGVPASLAEELLRDSFQRHLARHGDREFRLRFGDASPEAVLDATRGAAAAQPDTPKMLRVSVRLASGDWLNFSAVVLHPRSIWSIRFILSMLAMTISMIAVSVIVIRRINVPLRRFAYAAERLGTNIDSPPVPVRGPREIRQVASAFNEMQRRIHRLIEDRRQILAAVTHDLRTPITLIRLRAEHIDDAAERDKILATLDEMELMVTSILEFTRLDAASEPVRMVDLAALIRSHCDDMADLGRPVTFEGPDRLAYDCRPTSFRRAFNNLLDNAVKYGERARVALADGPAGITITIDDDGPGIPEAELESVFAPFYRVDRSQPHQPVVGIGLGLSVARQVVAVHGGEIVLANREAGGLRVTIGLPPQPEPVLA